ncbi:MAG: C-terminal binding protein [Thalassobaculales bacterium]
MTEPFRILVPDAQYVDDSEIERAVAGPAVIMETRRAAVPAEIPDAAWEACDAALLYHVAWVTPEVVRRLKRCRILVRAGVGYDQIDLRATGAAGIPVCNVPDYGTSEVADHAIALMLAAWRGITAYDTALKADPTRWDWQIRPDIRRLRGRRLGIVGLGRIGTATALRAKAFGLAVAAYDPYLPSGQEIAVGVERVDRLTDLMAGCDIISIHTPLNEETRGLIGEAALAAMAEGSVLVNTARGGVIDLDALDQALRRGRPAIAALDVLPYEPPHDHPLIRAYRDGEEWLANRLILTPHAAWYSRESQSDARRKAMETALAWLRDGHLRNCVNTAWLVDPRR